MDWATVADRCLALLAEPTGNAEDGWTNERLREQVRRKFGVALEEHELAEMMGRLIEQGGAAQDVTPAHDRPGASYILTYTLTPRGAQLVTERRGDR